MQPYSLGSVMDLAKILGMVLSFLACVLVLCLAGKGQLVREQNQTLFTVSPTQARTQTEPMESLTFPMLVPGTDLVVQHMVCYEGPFIEDGSDLPVSNIMALILCNYGTQEIRSARVWLEGEGGTLEFRGSNILPGMSVMVLEKNMAPYTRQAITGCTGIAKTLPYDSTLMDSLLIEEINMGTLQVTNIGSQWIPPAVLYHKNHLPDGTYVGGISYCTPLEALEPGQTVLLHPNHYAAGYSRVFKVEN